MARLGTKITGSYSSPVLASKSPCANSANPLQQHGSHSPGARLKLYWASNPAIRLPSCEVRCAQSNELINTAEPPATGQEATVEADPINPQSQTPLEKLQALDGK